MSELATNMDPIEVNEPDDDSPESAPTVPECLEMALQVAADTEMPTSELMGLFFYYAHSIAASYRDQLLQETPPGAGE